MLKRDEGNIFSGIDFDSLKYHHSVTPPEREQAEEATDATEQREQPSVCLRHRNRRNRRNKQQKIRTTENGRTTRKARRIRGLRKSSTAIRSVDAGRICATWRYTLVGTRVVGRKWIGITLFCFAASFTMGLGIGGVDAFPLLDRWRPIGICLSGARNAVGRARADAVT